MADIEDYSTTPASNTTDWAEGQAPSTVNDSGREMQADIAKYLTRMEGNCTIGGTANAITATFTVAHTAHRNNRVIIFRAGSANTGAATFQLDSLTAYAVTKNGGVALSGGEFQANGVYILHYLAASTRWELVNPSTLSSIDINGTELILDADGDTSITADTDDQIDFRLGGTDIIRFKTVASAVNGIDFFGSATGNQPYLKPLGTDSNFGLDIRDSNGNEIIIAESVASAVNELTITNNSTGNDPSIAATGGDTNINVEITPKGTGVLTLGGSDISTKPAFSVHRNGVSQGSLGTAPVKMKWTTEVFDTNSNFSHDADDSGGATENRFTPTVAGKYLLTACVTISAASGQKLYTAIYKNGAVHKARTIHATASAGVSTDVSCVVDANGTDYFEVYACNLSAGSANDGTSHYTYWTGCKID